MRSLECADWFQESFNALLEQAESRTRLSVSIKLYGAIHLPSFVSFLQY